MKQAANQRLKVLYIITKATWGGAQRYVYDLATNLPKEKFDVIVAYGVRGKLAGDLAASGIKLRELPFLARDITFFSDIKSFFEILRVLRALRPDVIHLNSSKAAALGALAARFSGVRKIVFTVHGWPFKESRNVLWRVLTYKISWLTAFLSHSVIVVSKTDERLARRMWGITKKVHYVPLGRAPFDTLPPSDAFRAMFGSLKPANLKSSTLRLVTIGELTSNKNIRAAIDAVATLSEREIDAVYVVAGEGEERAALEMYAKKLGVGNRVFFPGFVADASRNLSGFDVFVLPSIKEGAPYVLLEAALAGLPIVATSVVDEDFIASLSSARLVPARDTTALADAIIEVARIPRAREKRESVFALSTMVQNTSSLYTS